MNTRDPESEREAVCEANCFALRYSAHLLAALLLLLLLAVPATAEQQSLGLAVFKLGERYATDEHAGPAIDQLCEYLGERIDGAAFARTAVHNQPGDAARAIKEKRPALGIVSPGFYLKHRDELKLTAFAEARRGGVDGERYTLVGAAETTEYPAGKRVATTLTADLDWLNRAVLPAPEGAEPVKWVAFGNLFDAGYAIIDEEDDAPDFVLLDQVSLAAFRADADMKELKAGLQSARLPQDIVVEIDGRLGERRADVARVLAALDRDDKGKRLGELLQSSTFVKHNEERLAKLERLWKQE